MFAPPDQAFRMQARLLAIRQGKRTLGDFLQELTTLIASMHQDPVQEAIVVTIVLGVSLRALPGRNCSNLIQRYATTFNEVVA